jgi:hypothetical protein
MQVSNWWIHYATSAVLLEAGSRCMCCHTLVKRHICLLLPCSLSFFPPMQVHTAHSNVGSLSPLLRASLSCQLVPFSSADAPLQLQAACFPGCVQLLANVFALPAAAAAASGSDSGAVDLAAIQSSSFVATLLGSLTDKLKAVYRAGAGLAGQWAGEGMPAIDVVVGSAATSSAAAAAGNAPTLTQVSLQWCDLACLTADQQQQLTLHLQLAAAAEGAAAAGMGGAPCRLLCFNSAGVMVDEQAELQQTLR